MFEAYVPPKREGNSAEWRNVTVSQVSCSRKKIKPAPKFSNANSTNWKHEIVPQRAEPEKEKSLRKIKFPLAPRY